jgi:hypothetical protein
MASHHDLYRKQARMKKYLLGMRSLWRSVLVLDAFLILAGLSYCLLATAPLSLEPGTGFFAFLALLGVAFCEAQILRRNNSAFTLAARLPFRYETFFIVFLSMFAAPLLCGFGVPAALLGILAAITPLTPAEPGFFFRALQCLFAFVMIKTFSIHLFLIIHRGIGWLAAYLTLLLTVLFALKMAWDFVPYPAWLFAFLYAGFQAGLIFIAIRRGFHHPV